MRHLGAAAIGVLGLLVGVLVASRGTGITYAATMRMQIDQIPAGAVLILLGGLLLGGVAYATRLSPAAPLTAAAVLLLVSLYTWFDPPAVYGLGSGIGYFLGMQFGLVLAGMYAVVAFVVPRRARTDPARPVQPPSPGSGATRPGPTIH